MKHPFVQYLINQSLIPGAVARRLTENSRGVREPIGMIAVDHGLLNAEQIDTVLDRQCDNTTFFWRDRSRARVLDG